MKDKTPRTLCPVCHEVIRTQHVFSENNQVYLKQEMPCASKGRKNDHWFPVNFQWMPVMELKHNLEHQ